MPSLKVDGEYDGVRFDRFLRQRLPHVGLAAVFRLIRTGCARVNGKRCKAGQRLADGDEVTVHVAQAEVATGELAPEPRLRQLSQTGFFQRNFRIVFEDDALIACDKPVGLVVHPGSGHEGDDTLIALAQAYILSTSGGKAVCPPGLVHRLDRDTSGVILLAKDRAALRTLHEDLRAGAFQKRYLAVVHGAISQSHGVIETPLVKSYGRNDGTKVSVGETGSFSRSTYTRVHTNGQVSLLEVTLDTGRTHQIRVHMQHLGFPIVGDPRYGDAQRDRQLRTQSAFEPRMYLHAWQLRFPHPVTRVALTLTVDPPSSFEKLSGATVRKEQLKTGANDGIIRMGAGTHISGRTRARNRQ